MKSRRVESRRRRPDSRRRDGRPLRAEHHDRPAGRRGAEARRPVLPLDVHLMISDPDRYLDAFADAGASSLIVHAEVLPHLHRTLTRIRQLGLRAGVAINPSDVARRDWRGDRRLRRPAGDVGQSGIRRAAVHPAQHRQGRRRPGAPRRAAATRPTSRSTAASTRPTPTPLVQAGATILVAGASIFGTPDPAGAAHALRAAALGGQVTAAMPSSVTTLRVRYAETDRMGVVYYANYFVWFEVARTDLLRTLGWTYREMEDSGVMLPVIDAHCEYRRPARYDDEVEVRTTGRLTSPVRMDIRLRGRRQRPAGRRRPPAGRARGARTATGGPAACRHACGRRSHESAGHRRGRVHRLAPDSGACSTSGADVVGIDCFTDYYARSVKERQSRSRSWHGRRFGSSRTRCRRRRSIALLDGVTTVFHLAAQAGVRKSWGDDFRVYTSHNVDATQRLLEAVKDRRLHRFVYASSSSVYGDVATIPMREDSVPPARLAVRRDEARGRASVPPLSRQLRRARGLAALLHGLRTAAAAGHGVPPVHPRGARPGSRSPSTATANRRATSPSWPTSSRRRWRPATAAGPAPSITSEAAAGCRSTRCCDLIGRAHRPAARRSARNARRRATCATRSPTRPGPAPTWDSRRRYTLEAGLAAECDWLARLLRPSPSGDR